MKSDNNPAAAAAHPVCAASCRCGSNSCAAASAAARSARRNSASGTCRAGREESNGDGCTSLRVAAAGLPHTQLCISVTHA